MGRLRIHSHNQSKGGFTIVELLIVVVVIAILAAITLVTYNGVQARARDTRRLQDMSTIVKALELYRQTVGQYPAAISTPNASGWEVSTNGTAATNFLSALVTSNTVSSVPVDPVNKADPLFLGADRAGEKNLYFYHRYSAGANGCDPARGDYYVVGVTRMDTVPKGQNHPKSPGFICPDVDWSMRGAWVTGGYTN